MEGSCALLCGPTASIAIQDAGPAMTLLKQAVAAGHSNRRHMDFDYDFDYLRPAPISRRCSSRCRRPR